MDTLTRLFREVRTFQSPYERIKDAKLAQIASNCGRDEVAAIHIRLKMFRSELAECPDWDGDTKDLIWDAINLHNRLLKMIELLHKP